MNIQRDISGAQLKEQVVDVRSVSGGVVYLYFLNNSFRRHFLLPSKKSTPTPAQSKMERRALKRYRIYDRKGMGTTGSVKKQLEGKYSIGAKENTVVDLGAIDPDTAMAEMAKQILDADVEGGWQDNDVQEMSVSFSQPCVKKVAVSHTQEGDGVSYDHAPASTNVNLKVIKSAARTYKVSHLILP